VLGLAALDDGTISVQDTSEVTLSLLWSLVYDVPSGNFAMVNMNSVMSGTPGVLGVVGGSGAVNKLALVPARNALTPKTTWDVADGGRALAVRPGMSSSLNLNVQGGGPYPVGTPVIAYGGWNGGQPNEIWTFTAFGGDDYPWNYTFAPMCAPQTLLSANPQDAGGQLTIEAPAGPDYTASSAQLWSANYVIQPGTTPLGAVFVNQELGMAIRTTPGFGAIFCADATKLDAFSAWRVGGAPDVGAWAVHSTGNDGFTWNVSGAGPYEPGNAVIAYPWQGGAENEQWAVTFVPHEVT
jgi:hypothetical protein